VLLFRLLNKDVSISVFEELAVDIQENLIMHFADEKAVSWIISEMKPDYRVRLLDELPAKVAKEFIRRIPEEERGNTAALLGYEPESAGWVMTPEYISLKANMTVVEALATIRKKRASAETVCVLYVTDEERKIKGVLSLGELVTASESQTIKEIMTKKVIKIYTDSDQEEAARLLQERDLLAVPVVDKEERLVGIVTVDEVLDILEEETTEDMFDKVVLSDVLR